MHRDPVTGIAVLDHTITYRDEAESRVLEILESVSDRSSTSDELARHVDDWPTLYHFSRARGRLLRPLALRPGMRVLDVGAGTGAVARSLGERGARVVALEGNLQRARAAAVRCADLDTVEVVCGSFDAYADDDGFDLVCFVGVLEYAGSDAGGGLGPGAALKRARDLLRPGGAVVVAIENQLGLKYLLGYPEDHLGRPFAGVEGYQGPDGVRTWSRRALARLLSEHGLPGQRWLYPYPDYKLPSAILADRAFDEPDAATLVDALVRRPSSDAAGARPVACDDRRAHRVFLGAGLGRDVANSFLVVASAAEPAADGLVPDDVLAWFFGRERLRSWMRSRVVVADGDRRSVRTAAEAPGVPERRRGWLRQHAQEADPFAPGPTVEQLALAACGRRDVDELRSALHAWRCYLDGVAEPREPTADDRHPFLPAGATRALPGDHLDVSLSNIVVAGDGPLLVDREWEAAGGVDPVLAALRALWYLANDLVADGATHPFNPESSADELTLTLAELAGVDASEADLGRLRRAESQLQAKVSGRDADAVAGELEWLGRRHPLDGTVVRALPFAALQRRLAEVGAAPSRDGEPEAERLRGLEEALGRLRSANAELEHACRRHAADLERYREGNATLEAAVTSLRNDTDQLRRRLAERTAERDAALERVDELQRERAGTDAALGSAQTETAELRRRLASRSAERDRAVEESHRLRAGNAELEGTLAEHRAALEHSRREAEALRVAVARLEREADRSIGVLSATREELAVLRDGSARLDRDLQAARADLTSVTAERDEARAEAAQHEIHRRVDGSRIADLRSQLEDLQHRLDAAANRIAELEGEVGHWRQWRAAFESRFPVRLYRRLIGRTDDAGR